MRTHLEFRSDTLRQGELEDGEVGGRAVAMLLTALLPHYGFAVIAVVAEDWGWRIDVANAAFPLWIGCGSYYEYGDGILCFIEPSRPYVRRWLKRIPTGDTIEALANAIEAAFRTRDDISGLRWWTDAEVDLGRR